MSKDKGKSESKRGLGWMLGEALQLWTDLSRSSRGVTKQGSCQCPTCEERRPPKGSAEGQATEKR